MAVATGQARSAAAIVRPPGHHAESGMAMGFCFYNNAAIAARAARAAGAERVLVLDWVSSRLMDFPREGSGMWQSDMCPCPWPPSSDAGDRITTIRQLALHHCVC